MSQQAGVWALVFYISLGWAALSAVVATVSVYYERSRLAWGWTASFFIASVVAAYSFWRLP